LTIIVEPDKKTSDNKFVITPFLFSCLRSCYTNAILKQAWLREAGAKAHGVLTESQG
jgi:hypothetical protein